MGYRNYSDANGFIVDKAGNGDFTTIQAAVNAAVAPMTVFVRPGTYTENITHKAGVNVSSYGSGSSLTNQSNVIIIGNNTFTGTGTVTICGIQLQTNSAKFLTVSGLNASIVNLNNCYLNCLNASGITYSSTSPSSGLNINHCNGDMATTAVGFWANSGQGIMNVSYCNFTNSGGDTTTSNTSTTTNIYYSNLNVRVSTSGTGKVNIYYSNIDCSSVNSSAISATAGTMNCYLSQFAGGTAVAVNVSSTAMVTLNGGSLNSTNAAAASGAGTLNYQGLAFTGTATAITVTTQTMAGTLLGGVNQAPTSHFLGQQTTSSVATVTTTSTTAKNLTSVSLGAGIWDVSGVATAVPTGGTALMSDMQLGISATSGTISGTVGQQYAQMTASSSQLTVYVPVVRVIIQSTTSYFLVIKNTYSSTTCPTNGRMTATRVA